MAAPKRVIVWFRQDLRIHDNEALTEALNSGGEVIPLYIFDERVFSSKSKYGFSKTGAFRAKFIIEAVRDLRRSFRAFGSDLVVRYGKPEDIIYDIARKHKVLYVYCNRERTQEEVDVQNALEKKLWTIGSELRFSRGKMLYYTSDLPFPITHCPDHFNQFRKEVERIVPVRKPLKFKNTKIRSASIKLDSGEIPTLAYLNSEFDGLDEDQYTYRGGETQGLLRLGNYIWASKEINNYSRSKELISNAHLSSGLSPYISQGCLSPKMVFHEIVRFENKFQPNDSTYQLKFELYRRDFLRLMGKKHGNNIFKKGGIKQEVNTSLTDDLDKFKLWSKAKTGVPLIDAIMTELNTTGYISGIARRITSSFLVHDLKINWQIGAEYFEQKLVDYDPCSNWCNWNYTAGLTPDTMDNRPANILFLAKKYDPVGSYVRKWLPELKTLPNKVIHNPFKLNEKDNYQSNIEIIVDYPKPILNLS